MYQVYLGKADMKLMIGLEPTLLKSFDSDQDQQNTLSV